jgi:hypothetical protein
MTVSRSLDLQTRIFEVVSAAVSPLEVFDHAPTHPPEEFVRLDGFSIGDASMKNGEIGRHSFEVHHFLRPVDGSPVPRGQTRTKTILATAHAALMAADVLGTRVNFEYQDIDTDIDGATMHGKCRYTITL